MDAHLNFPASLCRRHSVSQTPLSPWAPVPAVVASPRHCVDRARGPAKMWLTPASKNKEPDSPPPHSPPYIKETGARFMVFKENLLRVQTLYRWGLFPWQKIVSQGVWQFCRISHANLCAPKPNPPPSNFDANVLTFRQISFQHVCFRMSSFPWGSRPFQGTQLSLTSLPSRPLSLSPTEGHSFPLILLFGKCRGGILCSETASCFCMSVLTQGHLARTGCCFCQCGRPQLPQGPGRLIMLP